MEDDIKFMQRCIQLARCGEAGAAPNPMVGAVVVCDGRIIGEGFHRRYGGPHAEVNASEASRKSISSLEAPFTSALNLAPISAKRRLVPTSSSRAAFRGS